MTSTVPYAAATQPTFYFIGVTTGQSSIMRVFPAWADHLGLPHVVIKGINLPLHAEAAAYCQAVQFIKTDPLSLGALVTTHKIDLFKACRDLFEIVDPHAAAMGETSCISKRGGKLVCHAKDAVSSALALKAFLPERHFAHTGSEVFAMGAGGSTIAITWHLMQPERGADLPARIVVADPDQTRLDDIRRIHAGIASDVPVDYVLVTTPARNDAVLKELKPGSLVINATGLGKDAPGSPLTGAARFPQDGIAWDLNYRGDLVFLDQARDQQQACRLRIEDGWTYFIHGWTQVMAQVFDIDIPVAGPAFEAISRIATAIARAA